MHIGIDPEIAQIWSFTIGWHGVLMFIGIVVGLALTLPLAKKLGIPHETTYTAAIWAVIFGFIGARLTHVIDEWSYYSQDLLEILAIQKGGLGWYGALIGGIVGVAICSRLNKFSLARFADAVAPGIILGLSIGRIGCTINGDAPGTETSLPWGFIYTHPDAFSPLWVSTHPAPVYEILWNMIVLVVLWRLWKRLSPDGSLFLVSLVLYAVGRFTISWFRAEDLVLGPLHQSHLISIAIFLIAGSLLVYRKTRLVKPDSAEENPPEEKPPEPGTPAPA
ncbi:MAG: prolipoprotein diacylglyceryl transferase [Dehalococcoidia bacterium]|nr:prolipoprotein diacylglyceryl transferase [Dehalococcoidia bacterium]